MSKKDNATEELIKNTAKQIFFAEGKFGATTQEIADAAGVNRTLVHYYFRSKDVLLKKILEDGRAEFHKKIEDLLHPEASFKDKMKHLIDVWMEDGLKFPFLDTYLVSKIGNAEELEELIEGAKKDASKIKEFIAEIEEEMERGNIAKMNPYQFILNIVSLVAHPIIMAPLFSRAFNLSESKYRKLIQERKTVILETLFKK